MCDELSPRELVQGFELSTSHMGVYMYVSARGWDST